MFSQDDTESSKQSPGLSKHRHLVNKSQESVYIRFLRSPTQNKPISMIVNPIFSECDKEFNSILKDQA